MNATVSLNHTIFCTAPANVIGFSLASFQTFVFLPVQIWILWLVTSDIRKGRRLAASDIFTLNLCLLELWTIFVFMFTVFAYAFNFGQILLFVACLSGSYMVGRPSMNSLICIERYMAVAHPLMYRCPVFVKLRYIGSGLVWIMSFSYGGLAYFSFPDLQNVAYMFSLSFNLFVISACSFLLLNLLLRPSPGETQKEMRHRQKKRAFVIITGISVCISVSYGLELFILSLNKYIPYDSQCLLFCISMWLVQQSSVIQPFLFLSKLGKFSCIKKKLKLNSNET